MIVHSNRFIDYIKFYNYDLFQEKFNSLSPREFRERAAA
ncbi:IS3 family transposase [Peribacillus frigoritolerans]